MEATFCFVDLAGFSALTEAHGDHAAADLVARFTELVAEALTGTDGRLVKTIGDAVLVIFPEPAAALDFIRRLWLSVGAQPDFPLLRAGLHHGEAVERAGDVFGAAVNPAARVASQASGTQVLATAHLAEVARTAAIDVTHLGSFRLRNLRDAVDLFALSVAGVDASEVIDPVCRMRVKSEQAAGRLRVGASDYWFCSLRCAALFAADPSAYVQRTL